MNQNHLLSKAKGLLPLLMLMLMVSIGLHAQDITQPKAHLGFHPGTDRKLFDYEELIGYFQLLDDESDMLEMRRIGESPMGKQMYIAFISSARNINRLDSLKALNRELALNHQLSQQERQSFFSKGKVFVYVTPSMHSNEVGPSQAAPLIAHQLLTTDTLQEYLNDVVLMVVPNHNPDGMNMVVHHYRAYKNTKYEGARFPGVYHKYVGHDNNRDFVSLTQKDTRAIARVYNKTWFPQVMVEKHQMGTTGPRYFVPPPHDPIAMNVDANLWNWIDIFGSHLMQHMTNHGLKGVSQQYLFDDYWPGTTETCIWKNVIGMLTEAARVQYATPVYIEKNELKTYGKGLGEYAKSINMPAPWEGGWWQLSDIVQYEKHSTFSIVETASKYRRDILRFRNNQAKMQVKLGKMQAPYFYIMPAQQHDQSEWVHLVNLLRRHGIETYTLEKEVALNGRHYQPGDVVVPMAQPFRPFAKEVLEKQTFPERHYTPGGKLIRPYDITSWSLPLHKGVKCQEINTYSTVIAENLERITNTFRIGRPPENDLNVLALTSQNNESYKIAFKALQEGAEVYRVHEKTTVKGTSYPAGSFFIPTDELPEDFPEEVQVMPKRISEIPANSEAFEMPEIGLIESYFHDMDAGWTRYVFDTYNIPFEVIRPHELKEKALNRDFDVLVFPDEHKSVLMKGKYKSGGSYHSSAYPPEYTKGMEKEGLNKVIQFMNTGGKIVAWGDAVSLFEGNLELKKDDEVQEEFALPFKNISKKLKEQHKVYVPGSLLRVQLKKDHPLTYGCRDETGIFYRADGVFSTSIPHFDMARRVIGHFPEENLLMSGYGKNLEALQEQPVMVWMQKGEGEIIVFGFNPQFRASTDATFKLLFNSLLP